MEKVATLLLLALFVVFVHEGQYVIEWLQTPPSITVEQPTRCDVGSHFEPCALAEFDNL